MAASLRKKPNVLSIPSGLSFAEALAADLLRLSGHDPLKLAEMIVLLPNRRACRTLQEAFLRAAIDPDSRGGASLLPRLMPIGDLDGEDLAVLSGAVLGAAGAAVPPAIGELKRRMLLARLIMAAPRRASPATEAIRLDQAVQLAQELARLLDQVETERKDFAALDGLVPDSLAQHWQLTVDFLDILRRAWPGILAEEGAVDPAERRNLLLDLQARLWRAAPPSTPIIAAGSTGSIAAAADLMAVVARLPQGALYLPGLDRAPGPEDWTAIEADPTHPQHGLALLLQRLEITRDDVADIAPITGDLRQRMRIVSAALLPAERSDQWSILADSLAPDNVAAAMRDVRRADCQTEQEEALTIAIALRGFIAENGEGVAALATPDRRLARRVAAQLRRWNIEIDDSAGQELSHAAPGSFLLLLAEAAASGWAPVPLLGLLKHPLAAAGQPLGQVRRFARRLDRDLLRGPRPAPGWDGLEQAIAARLAREELHEVTARALKAGIANLREATAALSKWDDRLTPAARLRALIEAAEVLAATDSEKGRERLWRGEAGEALADFAHDALGAFAGLGGIAAIDFSALLMELFNGIAIRPRFGKHPRLYIWGPLEARLQQPDLLVLGGLNEGTWPAESAIDPWLNRPMRKGFGLPVPERKIGLSAHDFQQAMGARRVLLTRAARAEGAPTVPSRWLLRLDAFLQCCGYVVPEMEDAARERRWASALDLPIGGATPGPRPAPQPGAARRPQRLSVTQIELWRRNPYAIYARHILGLQALDDLDQDPGAADLGSAVHKALHKFVERFPRELPDNALPELIAAGEDAFQDWLDRPNVWAFWQPRFHRIAGWWLEQEAERRPRVGDIYTERGGRLEMAEVTPPFALTARADRIDRFRDGSLGILDYKTGAPPSEQEIALGFAPQLTLEAAMAGRGAFADVAAGPVSALSHWRLSGSSAGGEDKPVKGDLAELAREAYDGLLALLRHYSRDEAAYPASPDPMFAARYDDYAHLAREAEWSSDRSES
jgi:ATP-dependent helicase/nuclease subunit B